MPGGAEVGSMFHNILELIDFETVYAKLRYKTDNVGSLINDPEIGDIILRQMDIYRVDKCWQQHICRIIANTLTTPVTFIDDEFVLGKLRKEERLHEVEFYYPFPLPLDDNKKIPDCKITNGFIKGFIDLVFKYAGKYYIADWKSNYIEDGYARDAMEINMNHANYHLQYKLYSIALIRWLKQTLAGRFNPAKDFGGVFYFYLRGMEPGTENGIYHVPAEKLGDLDRLEREVAGGQRSEVGGQRSEVGGRRSEVGDRKSEVRG
jgi:exodeoxyribonuclease V beta subunit